MLDSRTGNPLSCESFEAANLYREPAMGRYQQYCAPATTTCGPVLTLADCAGFLLRD